MQLIVQRSKQTGCFPGKRRKGGSPKLVCPCVTSNLLKGLGMDRGWDDASTAATGPVWLATEATLSPDATVSYYHGRKGEQCKWFSYSDNAALWRECERLVEESSGAV